MNVAFSLSQTSLTEFKGYFHECSFIYDYIVFGPIVPMSDPDLVLEELFSGHCELLGRKVGQSFDKILKDMHFSGSVFQSVQSEGKDSFFHLYECFMVFEIPAVEHQANEKGNEVFVMGIGVLGKEVLIKILLLISLDKFRKHLIGSQLTFLLEIFITYRLKFLIKSHSPSGIPDNLVAFGIGFGRFCVTQSTEFVSVVVLCVGHHVC